jgi:hypothetical protein
MLMEAEMESNERGGGLLGQMMGFGMMGGDFEDPRKRGHQGYRLSSFFPCFIFFLLRLTIVGEGKISMIKERNICKCNKIRFTETSITL